MREATSVWQPQVHQRVFRALVDAFSRPGTVHELGGLANRASALRLVLATLLDGATTLADPDGLIAEEDWLLLEVQRAAPADARFVVACASRAPNFEPALGTLERPELGATLVLAADRIGVGGVALELAGPGVASDRLLRITGLAAGWLAARERWVAAFPLGVDCLLVDASRVAALPRTTRVRALEFG